MCIHKILRPATPPQQPNQVVMPANPPSQPNQVVMPANPPSQPNHMEMPPDHEHMELDIPEDLQDLIDILEEVLLDFDAWAYSVLDYQW